MEKRKAKRCSARADDAQYPFTGLRISGPRIVATGRSYVHLYSSATGRCASMSTARYLMCVALRRVLTAAEHVDHINGDCSDDSLSNLQVLPRHDNVSKGVSDGRTRCVSFVTFTCPVCLQRVERSARTSFYSKVRMCSRLCAHAFQSVSKNGQDKDAVARAVAINNIVKSKRIIARRTAIKPGLRIQTVHDALITAMNFIARDRALCVKLCPCGSVALPKRLYCSDACTDLAKSKIVRPTKRPPRDELAAVLRGNRGNMEATGRSYGVTGAAVKSWMQRYALTRASVKCNL